MSLSFSKAIARAIKTLPDQTGDLPKELIAALLKINTAGLLTYAASPGKNKEPIITGSSSDKTEIGSERANIGGFMRSDRAKVFVEWINCNTDKVAYIPIYVKTTKSFNTTNEMPIPLTVIHEPNGLKVPFFYASLYITVNTEKANRAETHLSMDENVISVSIFDPVYGRHAWVRGGLINDILAGLSAV